MNFSEQTKNMAKRLVHLLCDLSLHRPLNLETDSGVNDRTSNQKGECKSRIHDMTNQNYGDTHSTNECSQPVDAKIVVVHCVDGELWMKEQDFTTVCDRIPVLRYLLVGYPGMRPREINLNANGAKSVSFSESMEIKKRFIGLINMYVLACPLFVDMSLSDLDFSELLRTLMTIGGWDVMNEICNKYTEDERLKYNVTAIRPYLDHSERFEWHFVLRNQDPEIFRIASTELQTQGFVVMPTYPGDLGINYRRKKPMPEDLELV